MEYDSCIRANQSVEQYVRNGLSYLLVLRAAAVTITSKSRFWSVFLLGTKRINKMEYNGVKKHGNGNPMKYIPRNMYCPVARQLIQISNGNWPFSWFQFMQIWF